MQTTCSHTTQQDKFTVDSILLYMADSSRVLILSSVLQVGMRHFNVRKNQYHCPIVNLDKLWSLVGQEVRYLLHFSYGSSVWANRVCSVRHLLHFFPELPCIGNLDWQYWTMHKQPAQLFRRACKACLLLSFACCFSKSDHDLTVGV